MPRNTLEPKPRFTIHRAETGAPVAADSTDLTTLPATGAIHAGTWRTLDGFVKLSGGTTPSVSLIPLMLAQYTDLSDAEVSEYVEMGSAIGPLSDGDSFTVDVSRGRLLMRLHAVAGSPTSVQVLLGGAISDSREER